MTRRSTPGKGRVRPLPLLAAIALLALPAATHPAPEETPPAGAAPPRATNAPPSASSQILAVSEAATHDGVVEGTKRFGEECLKSAKDNTELLKKFRKASAKAGQALNPTDRKLQRGLLSNIRANKTLAKIGKGAKWLADKVNVVAVVARTAGHAVEGDGVGAVGVMVDETVKRGTTLVGTTVGSTVPVVGSVAGAIAAEEAHQRVTRPWLNKKLDDVRTARAKKRLHGPAITKRGKEKDPPPDPDEPPPDPSAKRGDALLQHVTPTLVHAKGKTEDDMSSGEFKNIVTTTFALRFFNVGALVPGYASATLLIRSVSSLNGSQEKRTCRGRFTGGPNGGFRLHCKDGKMSFGLVNGQYVKLGGKARAAVDNPNAFAGWPR